MNWTNQVPALTELIFHMGWDEERRKLVTREKKTDKHITVSVMQII